MNPKRKAQIIRTAARLFRERGYNAVPMRDLAKEMGIKASSLYNHIPSKKDILAQIIMGLAHQFTDHISQTSATDLSVEQKLRAIIEMHVQVTINKTDYLACMNKEWGNLESDKQKTYVKLRNDYEKMFRKLLISGIQRGELREGNVEVMLNCFLSTLRNIYHWYGRREEFDSAVLLNNVSDNLLLGMTAQ